MKGEFECGWEGGSDEPLFIILICCPTKCQILGIKAHRNPSVVAVDYLFCFFMEGVLRSLQCEVLLIGHKGTGCDVQTEFPVWNLPILLYLSLFIFPSQVIHHTAMVLVQFQVGCHTTRGVGQLSYMLEHWPNHVRVPRCSQDPSPNSSTQFAQLKLNSIFSCMSSQQNCCVFSDAYELCNVCLWVFLLCELQKDHRRDNHLFSLLFQYSLYSKTTL